jgi:hypothetical protein
MGMGAVKEHGVCGTQITDATLVGRRQGNGTCVWAYGSSWGGLLDAELACTPTWTGRHLGNSDRGVRRGGCMSACGRAVGRGGQSS